MLDAILLSDTKSMLLLKNRLLIGSILSLSQYLSNVLERFLDNTTANIENISGECIFSTFFIIISRYFHTTISSRLDLHSL